ncbi:fumarylacetoacetate hydrolase family protein [Streptomyces araujoniae]|uniref:fumarylacetoacetate hydrolase family protein n=1 Tax=Streptomyces sp. ZEA17I TaxID=2202516 RepID=UPI0015E872C5|nr:fumarylacetoacetate hydrolase family protein [Streptomyces sp. ZEA17I]
MRLRRIETPQGTQVQYETAEGRWEHYTGDALGDRAYDPAWEADHRATQTQAPPSCRPAGRHHPLLPLQPLSFRDFLLYEQHNIDAARGLVRRFHPVQARVTGAWERIVRRPFPLFRPSALFYRQPVYYMGNHLAFIPSGSPLRTPAYTQALDYELELGFVLARPLLDATPEQALAAVGAFVLVNDFSARDVQRAEMKSGLGPQKSKHFANSLSATAVTADAILPHLDDLTGSVALNGTTVAHVTTAGARWSIGEALAHASRGEQLHPGELFATGTLPGGSGMENGHWLAPGDTLTLTLDAIGTAEHTILEP